MKLETLQANNYPLNSMQTQNLPPVLADFNYYRSMVSYFDKHYFFIKQTKPKGYTWIISFDTSIKVHLKCMKNKCMKNNLTR